MTLAQSILAGDRLALARTLTHVENDTPEGQAALNALFSHTGQAHLIGITGAPGTGKSSLVNQLALHYRKQQKRVAIVAIDPSSPFTGGAVLGDRVRMRDLSGDSGVFIRSMASRGSLGGLAG
jgi:LAO/AO transport system kinase